MKEEEMIREKDDKLRIVTLNLRCIEVLCGYTTKDLHSAYCNDLFSVLSFLKCSAEFNTLNYLCLKIFYFFCLKNLVLLELSHFLLSLITSSAHPNIDVPENFTSTHYSTSSKCLQWVPQNLRFTTLDSVE